MTGNHSMIGTPQQRVEDAAKAMEPEIFSDDAEFAACAALPETVEAAQRSALTKARAALAPTEATLAELQAEKAVLQAKNAEQAARIERLTEALTPSGATKHAYIGEFSILVERWDETDSPYEERIDVPWTTIKEIMAAIRARAALSTPLVDSVQKGD